MATMRYKKKPKFVMELTYEEAEVLHVILACVGGRPGTRKYVIDPILDALESMRIPYEANDIRGELTFIPIEDADSE